MSPISPFTALTALTALSAAALSLAPAAQAQTVDTDVRVLLRTGDVLSTGDTVNTILQPSMPCG